MKWHSHLYDPSHSQDILWFYDSLPNAFVIANCSKSTPCQREAANSRSSQQLPGDNSFSFCTFLLILPLLNLFQLQSFVFSVVNHRLLTPGVLPGCLAHGESSSFLGWSARWGEVVPLCSLWGTWKAPLPLTNSWPCADLAQCQAGADSRAARAAAGVTLQAVCCSFAIHLLSKKQFQVKSIWILYFTEFVKPNSHTSYLNLAWWGQMWNSLVQFCSWILHKVAKNPGSK